MAKGFEWSVSLLMAVILGMVAAGMAFSAITGTGGPPTVQAKVVDTEGCSTNQDCLNDIDGTLCLSIYPDSFEPFCGCISSDNCLHGYCGPNNKCNVVSGDTKSSCSGLCYSAGFGDYECTSTCSGTTMGQADCSSGVCCCSGTCSCSWIPGSCGAGTCSSDKRQETLSCNPSECAIGSTTRCVSDALCSGTLNEQCLNIGVNYGSTYWHYQESYTPDSVLNRDFQIFKDNDINLIVVLPHWSYMEPSMGSYRQTYIDDIRRVISTADNYDIDVIVDFHTLMHENSYTIPSWVSNYHPEGFAAYEAILISDTVRQAWLNMIDHVVSELSDLPNIHSWQITNEPVIAEWAISPSYASAEDLLDLWQETKDVVKSHSSKPVAVRFSCDGYQTWVDIPRTYEVNDYISVNWYGPEMYPLQTYEKLEYEAQKADEYGKDFYVSEFGYDTDDDELQRQKYVDAIEFFESIGVDNALSWIWRADNIINNPGTIGTGWHIEKDLQGNVRPAFNEISDYNSQCGTGTCSCSNWVAGSCGSGTCSSSQRRYTRTCTPVGCTPVDGLGTEKCVSDALCSGTSSCLPNSDCIGSKTVRPVIFLASDTSIDVSSYRAQVDANFQDVRMWYQEQMGKTFSLLPAILYQSSMTSDQLHSQYGSLNGIWLYGVKTAVASNGLDVCDGTLYYFVTPIDDINGAWVGSENLGCPYVLPGTASIPSHMGRLIGGIIDPGWPEEFADEIREAQGGVAHEIGHGLGGSCVDENVPDNCDGLPHTEEGENTIMYEWWNYRIGAILNDEQKAQISCGCNEYAEPATDCDSLCQSQSFDSGVCRALTEDNLADIPGDWSMTYGPDPQIIYLDNTVLHEGKTSIRLEEHVDGVDQNIYRKVEGIQYGIKPGDHIYASCWIKLSESELGDVSPFSGARIGLDFYGDEGRISALQSDGSYGIYPSETSEGVRKMFVPWGTMTWTKRTIDFTVPSLLEADGFFAYNKGDKVQPTSLVMWMQIWSSAFASKDPADGWFSDCELYINPSFEEVCETEETYVDSGFCSHGACCCSGTGTTSTSETTETVEKVLVGFSGTPTSTQAIDDIIDATEEIGGNAYRISFTPSWTTGTRTWNPAFVDYFLSNSDMIVVVDRNHHTSFDTVDWDKALEGVLEVCQRWPNNPRVYIELINEYSGSDFYTETQKLVDGIRAAGCNNNIVSNKHDDKPWQSYSDPFGEPLQGMHFYFSLHSVSGAEWWMQNAIDNGFTELVCTEVGAHHEESSFFDEDNVDMLNEFLQWCSDKDVGYFIWMNRDLNNLPKYQQLGLAIPYLQSSTLPPSGSTIWGANLYVPKYSISNPSGYASSYLSNSVFQAAKDMGITHILLWQYNFNENAQTITQAQMVDAVTRMKNYGLEPIIVLDYDAAKAASLVQALGDKCSLYEVCKEPHVSGSTCYADEATYVQHWNEVVSACRQVNPDAMYGGPAVGAIPGTSPRSESWMREWLENCDGDFVSVHAFYDPIDTQAQIISRAQTETVSDMAYLKSILAEYGKQNLPIIYSEVQWTAAVTSNGWDMDQNFNNGFVQSLMPTMEEQDVYAAMFWTFIGFNNNFAIIRPPSFSYEKKAQYYSIQDYLESV